MIQHPDLDWELRVTELSAVLLSPSPRREFDVLNLPWPVGAEVRRLVRPCLPPPLLSLAPMDSGRTDRCRTLNEFEEEIL